MNLDEIAVSFDRQAEWCAALDSAIYHRLLTAAAEDIRSGGPIAAIVGGFDREPVAAALSLRFMGGVHRLVLMGVAPELARHYPSVGGTPDLSTITPAFLDVVRHHPGYLWQSLDVAPQTNDTGRCAALLPALGAALDGRSHAIRLLEIGSAGGLNLMLDRYRYETDAWSWGPESSPVTIHTGWRGAPPDVPDTLDIIERRGCDLAPIDVTSDEAALRLLSFVWPDHAERLARTEGAISVVRKDPPSLDAADAPRWLAERLSERPGRRTLTVIQHSVMWQYLPEATKTDVESVISDAGAAASRSRPLAHVSFEPVRDRRPGDGFAVRIVLWPGGNERIVGWGHAHGAWIDWTG